MKKGLVFFALLSLWLSLDGSSVWAQDVGWMQKGVRVWYFGAAGTDNAEEAYLFTSINGNTAQLTHHSGINHWSLPTAVTETGSILGQGPCWIHPQVLQNIKVGDNWMGIRIASMNRATYTYDTFKNTDELSSLPYLLLPIKALFDLQNQRQIVKLVYGIPYDPYYDPVWGTAYFDAETGLCLFNLRLTAANTVWFILSEINYDFATQRAFAEDNGPHTGFRSNIIKTSSAANYVMITSSVETRHGDTVQMWVSTSAGGSIDIYAPPNENYCFFGDVPVLRRKYMTTTPQYPPENWNEYGDYLWWWVPQEALQSSSINVFDVSMTRTSTAPYTFSATGVGTTLYFSDIIFDDDGYMTDFSAKYPAIGLNIPLGPSASAGVASASGGVPIHLVDGLAYYRNTMGRAMPAPGAATLIFPSGTIITTTPTYTWNAVATATEYDLRVNDSTGNRILQWYSASEAGCASGVGTCSVTPAIALAPGPGTWWIQTKNSGGTGPLSSGMSFTVEGVSSPSITSGSTNGIPGTPYTFSAGGSTSNVGHSIQYFFDWGDGTNSDWLPVGQSNASHSWVSTGIYLVKAQARCATHTSVVSSWSGNLSVIIETISSPTTPNGPAFGALATSYSFSTGGSTTGMGHSVQYFFDWGDGTTSGWLPVGTSSASHSYTSIGTYTIKAQARCSQHLSVLSLWSPVHTFTIETISNPTKPNGVAVGRKNNVYTYSSGNASSSEGHSVQYFFDWGDGANSGWLPADTTIASKSWTNSGTYSVKVRVRCSTDVTVISAWSETLSVMILEVPTVTSFNINSGAASTTNGTVTLNHTATNSPTHYMASESSDFTGASWQTYSPAPSFTFSGGAGTKTVYFKVRRISDELVSPVKNDTIEALSPTVTSFKISAGAVTTSNNEAVTLNNTTINTPTHYMASENPNFNGTIWQKYSPAPSFALSSAAGTKTVYFKVKNFFGESAVVSDTITALAPVVTSFKIDMGALSTANGVVTLNNTATNLPKHYMASEDPGFAGATWQTYSAAPKFTLSTGSGTKTVHFKVKNSFDESAVASDTISALTSAVTSFKINAGAASTGNGVVTLNNTATNSPTHYMASEDPGLVGAIWQNYFTAPKFTLSDGAGTKTVYFKVKNWFDESPTSNDTISTSGLLPVVTSFKISAGALNTAKRTVTLNNTATNYPMAYMASEASDLGGATWQAYSTSPSFALSTGIGMKKVYFKVGNIFGKSAVISDTISALPPAVTSFKISAGALNTAKGTVTLNNTASNSPTHYMASELSNFAGGSWQTYSTAASFTLSAGTGAKTVYFKVKNSFEESGAVSDTISALPPAVTSFKISAGALNTAKGTVTLNNTATNSPTHYMASELPDFAGAIWQTYSTAPSFSLSAGSGAKTVYFKVKNSFYESNVLADAISALAPVVTSLRINAGGLSTADGVVTLNNTATNIPTHYMASEASDFAGASWQTYSTAPKFTLSDGTGTKRVYFKVKNSFDESGVVSDTISTSGIPPVVTSFKINAGALNTARGTVTLNNVATKWPTHYMASEDPDFVGATWLTYSSAPSFVLSSGTGSKTVYFKVKNGFGQSSIVSNTIAVLVPSVTSFKINAGSSSTATELVTLNNTASNSPTHCMLSEDPNFVGASWQVYSTAPKLTLSSEIGTKTIYFKVKNAFDESAVVSDTIYKM